MELNINSKIGFGCRQDILSRLKLSSGMTKQYEKLHFRDTCMGIDQFTTNSEMVKKPILNVIRNIVEDSEFTRPTISSFTNEELKPVADNLTKIADKNGTINPLLRFKNFFEEYLSKQESTSALNDKSDVVNSLLERIA